MISHTLDRIVPSYFCSTLLNFSYSAVENGPRVKVQFNQLLENYRKEGLLGNEFKYLSDTLDALDTVFEAFEFLSVPMEHLTRDNLLKAFSLLTSLKSIFVYKTGGLQISEIAKQFSKLDSSIQRLFLEVAIC